MTVAVVGNVIEFDGYHIARISTAVPATVRGRFEEALENAHNDRTEQDEIDRKVIGEGLDSLIERIKAKAEAGMVEVSDVEAILNEVKAG